MIIIPAVVGHMTIIMEKLPYESPGKNTSRSQTGAREYVTNTTIENTHQNRGLLKSSVSRTIAYLLLAAQARDAPSVVRASTITM